MVVERVASIISLLDGFRGSFMTGKHSYVDSLCLLLKDTPFTFQSGLLLPSSLFCLPPSYRHVGQRSLHHHSYSLLVCTPQPLHGTSLFV
jgi:hypothetical protein